MSAHSHLFPITMQGNWLSPDVCDIHASLRNWLLDPTSLTARLKSFTQHFRVEVVGQHIENCSADEGNTEVHEGEPVLVREVLLYCDDIPQVFARSLLPLRSLTGEQQQLAHLGNQSLGQILFNDPALRRTRIEIASFDGNTPLVPLLASLNMPNAEVLWGRRSVFFLAEKPLMVAEIFLPGAFAYEQGRQAI